MGCPRDKIQSMLVGDLSADQTHRLLDHMRDCVECRKTMDLMVSSNPSNFPTGGPQRIRPMPRAVAGGSESRTRKTLSRRTMVFVLITAVVAITAWRTREQSGGSEGDLGPICRDALRAGQAFVLSPQGILNNRPRVVEVLVPLGVQSCSLEIEREGAKPFRSFFILGGQLNADRIKVKAGGEELEVLQLLVPFPDHESYPLNSPADHRLRVVPEPGRGSSWTTVKISDL